MSFPTSALLLTAALAAEPSATRFFLPSDVTVRETRPSMEEAFHLAARTGDRYGVRVEMEIARGGQPFRAVPLSTPVCTLDSVALTIMPSAGGYLNILNQGTSGRWSQIFPSDPDGRPDFSPGRPARVPAATGWGFEISGDPGQELLLLFFSPGPISGELMKFQRRLLGLTEPPKGATGGGSRGPEIGLLRDISPAGPAYLVGQGEQTVAITLDHRASCPALP